MFLFLCSLDMKGFAACAAYNPVITTMGLPVSVVFPSTYERRRLLNVCIVDAKAVPVGTSWSERIL